MQDMIESFVKFSNIKGKKLHGKQWLDISTEEMWATIGVLISIGIMKGSNVDSYSLWGD